MSTLHTASRRDYRWWQVLTWAPHRVMFAAGAIQGTLALAGWFQDLLADYTGWYRPLELNIPEAWAHGYLMVYGFFPFFMFGFLMTALPNWVGQEKPTPGNYVPAAGLMFLGVTLFYAGMLLFEPLIYLDVALQLGGWLVGLSGLVRRVRAAQGEDLRHPPEWVRVGRASDWTPGRGRAVDLDGTKVAVFRKGDRWLAFIDACPHMGASLADGRLVGNDVECVWHQWRYDVDTGKTKEREWACLDRFEIKEEAGEVFLLRPDPPPPPPEEDDPEWLDWEPERFFRKKSPQE